MHLLNIWIYYDSFSHSRIIVQNCILGYKPNVQKPVDQRVSIGSCWFLTADAQTLVWMLVCVQVCYSGICHLFSHLSHLTWKITSTGTLGMLKIVPFLTALWNTRPESKAECFICSVAYVCFGLLNRRWRMINDRAT